MNSTSILCRLPLPPFFLYPTVSLPILFPVLSWLDKAFRELLCGQADVVQGMDSRRSVKHTLHDNNGSSGRAADASTWQLCALSGENTSPPLLHSGEYKDVLSFFLCVFVQVWSYQLTITKISNQSSLELGKILLPNILYPSIQNMYKCIVHKR